MPYRTVDGSLWVDGGVRYNFGWNLLTKEQQAESIGFFFGTPQSGPAGQTPISLSQYLLRLIHFGEKTALEGNLVRVHIPNFPAWFINLQEEDRLELASAGRAAGEAFMKEWLVKNSGTPPDPVKTLPPSPLPEFPAHPPNESSGTLTHSLPLLHQDLHHNPPLKSSRLIRRWSV